MFTIRATVVLLALLVSSGAMAQPVLDADAARALDELVKRHRALDAIDVTCTLTIGLAQDGTTSTGEPVKAIFKHRTDGTGLIEVGGYRIHVGETQIHATHESNPDEYFEYDIEDFVHTTIVWVCFGGFERIPFPHLAILWGSDTPEDIYMELYVDTPEIVPTGLVDRTVGGRAVRSIELSGPDGTMVIDTDPKTLLVARIQHEVTAGAVPGGTTKTLTYDFEYPPDAMDVPVRSIAFEGGDRQKVGSILTLEKQEEIVADAAPVMEEAAGQLVGQEAPGFLLQTATGDLVDLKNLKGNVVVVDFWAVWCPPCRAALPELHAVAAWAEEQGFPVKVYAVNTFENGNTIDQKIKVATEFFEKEGHTLPILMDHDSDVAGRYGVQGIPATIVIGPDGTVFSQHSGFGPGYGESLKKDISEALKM